MWKEDEIEEWRGQSIKVVFLYLIKLYAACAPLHYKDCTYDC